MQSYQYLKKVVDAKIVAVVRADSSREAIAISESCLRGGIQSIELTFTTPQAEQAIQILIEKFPDKSIGAGTVLDAPTAKTAIQAGAQFVVSPAFDEETAKLCNLYQIPYIPGCMTVTEMRTALTYGCSIVKMFPGGIYGPAAIKQFKGPLPQLSIMPTGGVDLDNIEDWFAAGAVAVGAGSSLTKGSVEEIEERAREFTERISVAVTS